MTLGDDCDEDKSGVSLLMQCLGSGVRIWNWKRKGSVKLTGSRLLEEGEFEVRTQVCLVVSVF